MCFTFYIRERDIFLPFRADEKFYHHIGVIMFALRNTANNATGAASSVSSKTNAKKNNVINCRRRGQLLKKRFPSTKSRAKAKTMSIRNGPETVPIVVPLGDGSQQQDLFTFLVNNRIVFIGERIDEDSTAIIVAQMLALESEAPNEPITLYINATAGTHIARRRDCRQLMEMITRVR